MLFFSHHLSLFLSMFSHIKGSLVFFHTSFTKFFHIHKRFVLSSCPSVCLSLHLLCTHNFHFLSVQVSVSVYFINTDTVNASLQGGEGSGIQHSLLPEPSERCLPGQEKEAAVQFWENTRGRRLSRGTGICVATSVNGYKMRDQVA